jgi:photosystem II stability/assembly factor-like uncharacterized protein
MSTTSTRALAAAAALALFAGEAAAQWHPVDAPDNPRVVALAASSAPGGGLITSVQATQDGLYLDGGNGWSLDDGETWERSYHRTTPVLSDIVTHPTNPDIMWGARYEVWKSVNGGRKWDVVYSHFNYVSAIAVDPLNPNYLYGCGQAFSPGSTFHQSKDGGKTWHGTSPMPFDVHNDVIVLPDPTQRIVILASGSGINRSTDGAKTFTNVLGGQTGQKLACAAQNPLVVWCVAKNTSGKTRLWRSIDGAQSFAKVTTPANDMHDVSAHPTDPARAWVVTTGSGVLYTLDGGQTWFPAAGVSAMARLTSIVRSPVTSGTLFAGDQGGHGGVWRSQDGGLNWAPSGNGLTASVPLLRLDGAGGAYGAGFGTPQRIDSVGGAWKSLEYGPGSTATSIGLSVDPSDPATVAWVDERQGWNKINRVVVSRDAGATWTVVTPQGAKTTTYEILQVAFDKDGALYATAQFGDVYRSQDWGQNWTQLADVGPWYKVTELVTDSFDANRLFATEERSFYRSEDQGQTWVRRWIGPQAERYPIGLTQDPVDPDVLYVLAGWFEKKLYRSADGGDTWAAHGTGFDGSELASFAVDVSNPARMLMGTEGSGVFLSLDGGATFAPFDVGVEEAHVVSVEFDPATPGRAWLSTATGGLFVHDF